MITDTVVITLQANQFKMADSAYDRFSPSVRNFFFTPYVEFGRSKSSVKSDLNPTKYDKESTGWYFPRLTMFKAVRSGGVATFLRIELSTQKLLYRNNFDEHEESDFGEICWLIVDRLKHFGIFVDGATVIANAEVSAIHYAKNIVMTDFTTPSMFIREIEKVDVSAWQDVEREGYRNGGHAIKFHTKHWMLIVYDKKKDLEQAHKGDFKAISRDNYTQMDLFNRKPVKRPFEIMRIEARYNDRTRIKALLKSIGEPDRSLSFQSLFSAEIAQKALQSEVAKLKSHYPPVALAAAETLTALLTDLRINNPESTFTERMNALAYFAILKEISPRDVRTLGVEKPNDWHKFKQRISKLVVTPNELNPFNVVDKALLDQKPVRLENYVDAIQLDLQTETTEPLKPNHSSSYLWYNH